MHVGAARRLSRGPSVGSEARCVSPSRHELSFDSHGTACAAWHYRGAGPAPRACVVLAHGFTMTRDAGLARYAERFAAAGLDALVLDYRCFGASAGTPRQWLDVPRQHDDWRAAIACARSLPDVDPERIALWGTSFSGGHVAYLAAEDPRIAAVVSQVPFAGLGGRAGAPRRPGHQLRMVAAALRDAAAARLGRSPCYLTAAAEPPTFAAFDTPGATEDMRVLLAGADTWENRFTPRVVLQMAGYKPFAGAAAIACPWLLQVCDPDTVTPAGVAVARASGAPRLDVRRHHDAHFAVYTGEPFERFVAEQVAFLGEHLGGPHAAARS